jgi:hypothetical protein
MKPLLGLLNISYRRQNVQACSRKCRAAHHFLPKNGPHWTFVVTTRHTWSDHLIACAIWQRRVPWKLKVTTIFPIFSTCFFNKGSQQGELVGEFCFALYIRVYFFRVRFWWCDWDVTRTESKIYKQSYNSRLYWRCYDKADDVICMWTVST